MFTCPIAFFQGADQSQTPGSGVDLNYCELSPLNSHLIPIILNFCPCFFDNSNTPG